MDATVDRDRWFSPEQGDVVARVNGLQQAVDTGRGMLDDRLLDDAVVVVQHAGERLRLSADHTIVALAGATGSGKSSLFNLLSGLEIAGVGVQRPTTSWALACAWGPEGSSEILKWMGIPPRNQVSRTSMLDTSSEDTNLEGLVLLDLPDHDSTEVSHHLEVDRLVTHADLLVWVLDPQKYADAAVHDRYLKKLTAYADVTMVVLNQVDRIPADQQQAALDDVRRLLVDDGLPDVPVLGTSALTGEGVDELKRALVKRIRDKQTARDRLQADVDVAATALLAVNGATAAPGLGEDAREALDGALAEAVGVPAVVDAVGSTVRRRAAASSAWPPARLLGRLRKDPLTRLDLDPSLGAPGARRASPVPGDAQRSGVEVAVRDVAETSSAGMPPTWATAVRDAATGTSGELADRIDAATSSADLGLGRSRAGWRLVAVVQWLLLLAAVAGLVWLVVVAVQAGGSGSASTPSVLGVPLPTILLVGGLVLGLLVALVGRSLAARAGRRAAEEADSTLRTAVGEVAHTQVVVPVREVLDRHEAVRVGLLTATGLQGSRRATTSAGTSTP
ncbi:MAG: GTPase [Nocardioidaceae bacterium]|nr:GTPase [Nocardioidaceae bacterium]